MAKKAQFDPNAAVKLAEELLAQLKLATGAAPAAEEAEETKEVDLPSAEDITAMKKAEVRALCEQLSIATADHEISDLRAALVTLSNIANDEEVDDEEVTTLLGILELEVSKKASANLAAVKEYLAAGSPAAEDEDSDEKKEEDEEKDEDSDEEQDEDEEETPAKKPAKKPAAETEDDEDGEEGDDDDADEKEEDDADEKEEDEEKDEESAEVSEKDQKKRLAAYNAVAEKPLKSYEKLAALLVDDDGDTADWGDAYVKNEEFHCCGLPLEDVKHKKKDAGKCQITGAIFVQDDEGVLKKVEE